MRNSTHGFHLMLPLAAIASLVSCSTDIALATDASRAPDAACGAACSEQLDVRIPGLDEGNIYEIVATTPSATELCIVDTSDGLQMTCDTFSLISSRIESAVIAFSGTPESVVVTVSLAGAEIATKTLTPAYEKYSICGQTCERAEVVFSLDED